MWPIYLVAAGAALFSRCFSGDENPKEIPPPEQKKDQYKAGKTPEQKLRDLDPQDERYWRGGNKF